MKNITALVLAAGFSSRMKRDKALLPLQNGNSFVEEIVSKLEQIGVRELFVIVREPFDIQFENATYLINPNPEKGMLYSIQIGVQKASVETEAVMIYPVDMPLVNKETLQILTDEASADSIILPKYKGRKRGHPILIGRNFWDDIMAAPLNIGARYVIYENENKIKEIITEDKGVTLNINTPDIYHEIIGKKGV